MAFVPIQLREYVRKHLKANRGGNERELVERLRETLA